MCKSMHFKQSLVETRLKEVNDMLREQPVRIKAVHFQGQMSPFLKKLQCTKIKRGGERNVVGRVKVRMRRSVLQEDWQNRSLHRYFQEFFFF